ncbi:MAG TPA: tetratricopeptide repeat protein [Albitalea sp.]|nr:tetratricopeptide repeat protein [Albitalea sp.]
MTAIPLERGLAQAIALYNGGRKADAHALCRALLERDPAHPAVHQLMAVLCMDSGDPQRAAEHIEHSLAARPGHGPSMRIGAQAWYEAGCLRRERGDAAGARQAWRAALALQAELAPAWFALSLVCEDLGEFDEARAALERLLALQPDHPQALVNLALLLQRSGDVDAAMDRYANAYRLQPETLGRIANALSAQSCGRIWLRLDDLKRELERRAPVSPAPRA